MALAFLSLFIVFLYLQRPSKYKIQLKQRAAYLGHPEKLYGAEIGKIIATDLKAVGINIDIAPDVDVNVNPLNPIIIC